MQSHLTVYCLHGSIQCSALWSWHNRAHFGHNVSLFFSFMIAVLLRIKKKSFFVQKWTTIRFPRILDLRTWQRGGLAHSVFTGLFALFCPNWNLFTILFRNASLSVNHAPDLSFSMETWSGTGRQIFRPLLHERKLPNDILGMGYKLRAQ